MKANEFVKKFGWGGAKRVADLTIRNSWADHYNIEDDSIGTAGTIYSKKLCEHNDNFVCLRSLKRLVESWELVEVYGGLSKSKDCLSDLEVFINFWTTATLGIDYKLNEHKKLKKSIADVESCQ